MEFGEELHRRKFLQVTGGVRDQLLETTEDVDRQGADGRVGNIPARTKTNKLVFNKATHILFSQSRPFSTDVLSV